MPPKILVSAGEASGEMYAAPLVSLLRERYPDAEFFGCAGPRMQAAGVRPVVNSDSLSVVGLVEVLTHIPRIYREFRKLVRSAEAEKPALAILTDSPDFHLRLARRLKRLGVPVLYLVAPQVWAWRRGRLPALRRNLDRLLCIFPFEEKFFRDNGVSAEYIGHPLAGWIRARSSKAAFLERHGLPADRPLIALLPGSRRSERARHLGVLRRAAGILSRSRAVSFALGAPPGYDATEEGWNGVRVISGETWDLLAHCDVALTASGTVTVEAALLGAPIVSYYKVTGLSWALGRALVRVPYYTMVNLIAARRVVPELMQNDMTPERLAAETLRLLDDGAARAEMKRGLAEVAAALASPADALERAAAIASEYLPRTEKR